MNYGSPISQQLVTALQGAARLANQIVIPGFVNMTLSSNVLTASAIAQLQALQTSEMLKRIHEQNTQLQRLLIKLGWPPPWHLPAITLDRITEANTSGNLSDEDVSTILIELYDQQLLDSLLSTWKQFAHLNKRHKILEEGIRNHVEGRFYSAVCLFLPQIEGVIGEELGRQPNPQNDAAAIFSDSTLSKAARNFYVRMAREAFSWKRTAPVADFSRHAILHGHDTSFGTPSHSLRAILLFDTVCSAIQERRLAKSSKTQSGSDD